ALWLGRARLRWISLACLTAVCGLGIAPIWGLPILRDVQFPWRLTGLFEFVVIVALAEWRAPISRWFSVAALVVALLPGALLLGGALPTVYGHRLDAKAIARGDDAPEYLPPTAHVSAMDRFGRTVDPRMIGVPALRSEITRAAE